MNTLYYAKERLVSFLDEIKQLELIEFPYTDSYNALEQINILFKFLLNQLESKKETGESLSSTTLSLLFDYLPYLGFILRSTNIRNAFEIYGPIKRLARDVLSLRKVDEQNKIYVLISSEWEYSPYVLKPDKKSIFQDFVMLGFPAPESSNPFIIPLSGHELGHLLFSKNNIINDYEDNMHKDIVKHISSNKDKVQRIYFYPPSKNSADGFDLFKLSIVNNILNYASYQIEESYCDFVGLKLFGTSYLYAFEYLLCPQPGGQRTGYYPEILLRSENLIKAAKYYNIKYPAIYNNNFRKQELSKELSEQDKFEIESADIIVSKYIEEAIQKAELIITSTGVVLSTPDQVESIYNCFERIVPAEGCKCLADLLNAGWLAMENPDFWKDNEHIYIQKEKNLQQLLLKNIEVFEYEYWTGKTL